MSTPMGVLTINPDRVRSKAPDGPRLQGSLIIACQACGATVEACPEDVRWYERDREPDVNQEYQYYEVYRCPSRECRADVVAVILEPKATKDATIVC